MGGVLEGRFFHSQLELTAVLRYCVNRDISFSLYGTQNINTGIAYTVLITKGHSRITGLILGFFSVLALHTHLHGILSRALRLDIYIATKINIFFSFTVIIVQGILPILQHICFDDSILTNGSRRLGACYTKGHIHLVKDIVDCTCCGPNEPIGPHGIPSPACHLAVDCIATCRITQALA